MKRRQLVKQDKDGIWFTRPYLGTNKVTKKPIRPYKRFPQAKTEAEAEKMAERWLEQQTEAAKLGVSSRIVELIESYIDLMAAQRVPKNTIKTHRSTLRCYIAPNVGSMRASEFTSATAQQLYSVVLMQESRRGGTISPNTVLKIHWLLQGAFKHFAANGIVDNNPMLSVPAWTPDVAEAKAYDEAQAAKLTSYLKGAMRCTDTSPEAIRARMVAFATYVGYWHGTRAGETCAISTTDAQLWRSNLHVHCTMVEDGGEVIRQEKTKGKKSRNITIYEDPVVEFRRHLEWADEVVPHAGDVLRMVVTTPDGGYMRASDLSHYFDDQIRDPLGLPADTHFHTLRHTHATWMILNGANLVEVKERLGHAKESTSLALYGHLMPGRDAAAVEAFAEFARRAEQMEGGAL